MLSTVYAGSTNAQISTQPPTTTGPRGPIANGRDIQPHANDIPGGQADPEATELLRQTDDAGPVVPPHDLYGNPLGVDTSGMTKDQSKTEAGRNDPGRDDLVRSPANPTPH